MSNRGTLRTRWRWLLLAALGASACFGPAPPPSADAARAEERPGQIVLAVEGEPRSLVPSVGSEPPGAAEHLFELLHQSLVSYDANARPIPRVAEALPSLSDGTWRLNPDGTMETTWVLREGVVWHDGRPLTVEDVVFSWRVFNSPAVPVVSRRAARLISAIEAVDPRTVLVRWRMQYAFADQLSGFDLTLLPAHLLEASFDLRPGQMAGHPYWQAAFVGLGPYRLARWIAGSSLELEPHSAYFLGPPSAPGMTVRFLPDPNAAMAAVLAGTVDVVLPRRAVLGIVQAMRQQWGEGGDGNLALVSAATWVALAPQFQNPQPADLRDVRVRQALAFALDRRAIAEAVTGEPALGADLWLEPSDPRSADLAAEAPRYAYRPDRALALLRDAGWRREGPDAGLVSRGERFELELTAVAEWHPAAALVGHYWRQLGVSVRENVIALGAVFDRQSRAEYSGVELIAAPPGWALLDSRLRSTNAPTADNGYAGANRGHYASRELDSLLDRWWQAVDPTEREATEREGVRHVAEHLPLMGVFFYPAMALVRAAVANVRPPEVSPPVARPMFAWNGHEWVKR